jgi:hypothetical protein
MSRLASRLDIYSQAGQGTVLRLEVWRHARDDPPAEVVAGGVCVPKTGEQVCGDGWTADIRDDVHRLLVVDGLGHGPDAAAAANTALRVANERPTLAPDTLVSAMHAALHGTRGAAASVASVSTTTARGLYAGIGNIRSFVREREGVHHLVSHNGTLGHQLRKIQTFEFAFPKQAILVMHSDGIASHWSLDAYPGLARHHPAVIAAVVYRDHSRGRDDATVAVLSRAVH